VNGETHPVQIALQSTLDQILPYMIPVLLVGLAYWLMRRFHLSAVWVLIALTIIGFGLGGVGVL
jgi:mannose PTS system EIID component